MSIFLLTGALVFGRQGSPPSTPANRNAEPTLCEPGSLPLAVQSHLREEFGSWRIQEPANLSTRAHERWESEKPLACPGIAVGQFENASTPSYALLLVSQVHSDARYKFLVFSPKTGQSSYNVRLADSGEIGAADFFIHGTRISKFFDEPSRKKFQAHAVDGILLVDSAENEYEVAVYFWANGRYQQQFVDY